MTRLCVVVEQSINHAVNNDLLLVVRALVTRLVRNMSGGSMVPIAGILTCRLLSGTATLPDINMGQLQIILLKHLAQPWDARFQNLSDYCMLGMKANRRLILLHRQFYIYGSQMSRTDLQDTVCTELPTIQMTRSPSPAPSLLPASGVSSAPA